MERDGRESGEKEEKQAEEKKRRRRKTSERKICFGGVGRDKKEVGKRQEVPSPHAVLPTFSVQVCNLTYMHRQIFS